MKYMRYKKNYKKKNFGDHLLLIEQKIENVGLIFAEKKKKKAQISK